MTTASGPEFCRQFWRIHYHRQFKQQEKKKKDSSNQLGHNISTRLKNEHVYYRNYLQQPNFH